MHEVSSVNVLIAGSLRTECDFEDHQRDQLVSAIRARYGDHLEAILIYGSYLRGKRDSLLDFYVLIDKFGAIPNLLQRWLARALPPNVFQIHCGEPPTEARAKYSLMTTHQFEKALQGDFHSYFWARFSQPSSLVYCVDSEVGDRIVNAIDLASRRFVKEAAPMCEDGFDAMALWRRGLSLTYQCELRSEPASHTQALVEFNASYYEQMTAALAQDGNMIRPLGKGRYARQASTALLQRAIWRWRMRKVQGKVLSVLRIVKASLTFDDALDYLLWKISRHSNIYIEPSPRQRKFPLLFAWPLLWRLYRRGAFR